MKGQNLDAENLKILLQEFKNGKKSEDDVIAELRFLPFEDLGFAKVDHHRALRTGFPEVVYGEGKTDDQILSLAEAFINKGSNFLVTRCSRDRGERLTKKYPQGTYYDEGRIFALEIRQKKNFGYVLVVTAGTSDIPAAEEAAVTADLFGCSIDRIYDVGVAGVHRLFAYRSMLEEADVIIVAAGMEGALASVVGSLTRAPVIALPTSIGYGAGFGGLAALLGMLSSCAPGVSVVNIDNGFGAGCNAALICRKAFEKQAEGGNKS